jgi:release factor glutamine methyltransferase
VSTIRDLLLEGRTTLRGGDSPYLDALVLLEWASGIDRSTLLAEQPAPAVELCSPQQISTYRAAIAERSKGRPVAYITGEKEFYGRPFHVGPGVLVPRPDSESLVTRGLELLALASGDGVIRIHDCCTGSGCLGITLALECAASTGRPVEARLSDIDEAALDWTRRNVESLVPDGTETISITLERRDVLSPVGGACEPDDDIRGMTDPLVDLVIANPPYLTETETDLVLARGWGEPRGALAAGRDGLDLIEVLVTKAFSSVRPGGYLIVEHGFSQGGAVRDLCTTRGYQRVSSGRDLAGKERYTEAQVPE